MPTRLRIAGRSLLAAAVLGGFAASAAPAVCQDSGGVRIRGNTHIDANAQNVDTIAAGIGNTAVTNIGTINGDTNGNTRTSVDVKNVENVVTGVGRKGCVSIGSHGDACK